MKITITKHILSSFYFEVILAIVGAASFSYGLFSNHNSALVVIGVIFYLTGIYTLAHIKSKK